MTNVTLTTEQAQQIEKALMKIADLRNLGKIQPEVIAFETLYTIRAARAQEQAEQEPVAWLIDAVPDNSKPWAKVGFPFATSHKNVVAACVSGVHTITPLYTSPQHKLTEYNISHRKLEQEPVAWAKFTKDCIAVSDDPFEGAKPLYAAPVRTKDLTDHEIYTLYSEPCSDRKMIDFARAVIAAYKDKNK